MRDPCLIVTWVKLVIDELNTGIVKRYIEFREIGPSVKRKIC